MSLHHDGPRVQSLVKAGAVAYVGKGVPLEVLVADIRESVGLPDRPVAVAVT